MSCHSNRGNLATISLAMALSHLDRQSVERLFHRLKIEGADAPQPDAETYEAHLQRMEAHARATDHASAIRIVTQLNEAQDVIPDGPTYYAQTRLPAAADAERLILNTRGTGTTGPQDDEANA